MGGDAFVHFVGGGMAGITAASVTYPLDLVRTRLAAQVRQAVFILGEMVLTSMFLASLSLPAPCF